MTTIRQENPVFRDGKLTFLLTDDANRTMAYGMRTAGQVAIVAVNRARPRRKPSTFLWRATCATASASATY